MLLRSGVGNKNESKFIKYWMEQSCMKRLCKAQNFVAKASEAKK